jgi:ubiquinone/menaquinone biosynthesis C-methylase UbiE
MVDVASHWSPYHKIVKKLHRSKIFRQDQLFKHGIHGSDIGSDCTGIPLPDGSVDMLAVNNSIEHFEKDKDALFMRESYRLLRSGGRLCIVPLFINSRSVNMVDPTSDLTDLECDEDALLVSAAPWNIRFARFYTPSTYKQRLIDTVPQFEHEIYRINGMEKFDPSLNYWQFVAVIRKV